MFVGVQTTAGGTVTVTSGSNPPVTHSVQAGVQMLKVPMGTGTQSFELQTAAGSGSGQGNVTISPDCWVGLETLEESGTDVNRTGYTTSTSILDPSRCRARDRGEEGRVGTIFHLSSCSRRRLMLAWTPCIMSDLVLLRDVAS